MLPEYKRRTNIGVGIGIVLQIASRVIDDDTPMLALTPAPPRVVIR